VESLLFYELNPKKEAALRAISIFENLAKLIA